MKKKYSIQYIIYTDTADVIAENEDEAYRIFSENYSYPDNLRANDTDCKILSVVDIQEEK